MTSSGTSKSRRTRWALVNDPAADPGSAAKNGSRGKYRTPSTNAVQIETPPFRALSRARNSAGSARPMSNSVSPICLSVAPEPGANQKPLSLSVGCILTPRVGGSSDVWHPDSPRRGFVKSLQAASLGHRQCHPHTAARAPSRMWVMFPTRIKSTIVDPRRSARSVSAASTKSQAGWLIAIHAPALSPRASAVENPSSGRSANRVGPAGHSARGLASSGEGSIHRDVEPRYRPGQFRDVLVGGAPTTRGVGGAASQVPSRVRCSQHRQPLHASRCPDIAPLNDRRHSSSVGRAEVELHGR